MKKTIGILASLMLAAGCSANANLHLQLNSNDQAAAALKTGSTSTAETLAGASDLTGVQHVNVTVNEVDVHVKADGEKAKADGGDELDEHTGEVDAQKVDDHDQGWQVVTTTPQSFDLMSIRASATQPLGDIVLPPGKVTEVRLKLATDGSAGGEDDLITGAVVDADGTVCDLVVPHSVINPGLKIEGIFKAAELKDGDDKDVVVNIKLKDSERLSDAGTCAFRLNPEIEIEKVEDHQDGTGDGTEHDDGGSDHSSVDGGV